MPEDEGPSRQSIATVYEESIEGPNPIAELLHQYLPGQATVFGIAVVSSIVWRIAKLIPPYLLGVTVDAFFTGGQRSLSIAFVPQAWIPAATRGQFLFVIGAFVAVALGTQVAQGVQLLSWRWFQQALLHDLRTDAYDATQRLDLPFFESERTGDLMSVLNNDVNQLEDLLGNGLKRIVQEIAFFIGLFLIMIGLHWQLTLLTLAFVPLTLGVVRLYQRLIEPRYDERRQAVGTLNAQIQNVVSGIATVKAFTNEAYERLRVRNRSRGYWQADWNAAKIQGVFDPLQTIITNATMLTLLLVGGWWALFGSPFDFGAPLSGGTFVTFYFYGTMFVAHTSRLGDLVDTYVDAKASAKRVFGLIHHPSTVTDSPNAVDLESIEGHIEYDDVTFTYPEGDSPALREVDFEVSSNEFVGLVGPTGAGKSTLMKLLLRFYTPDSGEIRIDGSDIEEVTVESLREAIGYVGQDPFLFDGTVRENIAYGDFDGGEDAIVTAAKRANAHGFITDLPEGYETEVGERGVKLSGGQRQRISIARALLDDPEILVLDEATSHVDNETEVLIQSNLDELIADRTTFAIAHRLSTVRHADRILVLEGGEIAEQGTHEELLETNGLYANLWNVQVGEIDSLSDEFVRRVTEAR